jgi:hypothetical protein
VFIIQQEKLTGYVIAVRMARNMKNLISGMIMFLCLSCTSNAIEIHLGGEPDGAEKKLAQCEVIKNWRWTQKGVITARDFIWFDPIKLEFELKPKAAGLLRRNAKNWFIVSIDRNALFASRLWLPIYSQPADHVVFIELLDRKNVFEIRLGYPTREYYSGEDFKSEKRLTEAVIRANILTRPISVKIK